MCPSRGFGCLKSPKSVVGQAVPVEADIFLGELLPEDVMVEVYAGQGGPVRNRYLDRFTQVMMPSEAIGDRSCRYRCEIMFEEAGHFGVNVRITPNHPNPESRHAMGLVIWGQI